MFSLTNSEKHILSPAAWQVCDSKRGCQGSLRSWAPAPQVNILLCSCPTLLPFHGDEEPLCLLWVPNLKQWLKEPQRGLPCAHQVCLSAPAPTSAPALAPRRQFQHHTRLLGNKVSPLQPLTVISQAPNLIPRHTPKDVSVLEGTCN